jgi:hypothetical protein
VTENSKFLFGQIILKRKYEIGISVIGGVLKVRRIKSKQGKLYIKEMNTNVFEVGDIFT